MASKFGRAGKSAREMADKRYFIRAGFGIVALILCLFFLKSLPGLASGGIGGLIVAFVIFKLGTSFLEAQIDAKIKEEKRAIRGAKGEERLEEILDELNEQHIIFYDAASR